MQRIRQHTNTETPINTKYINKNIDKQRKANKTQRNTHKRNKQQSRNNKETKEAQR